MENYVRGKFLELIIAGSVTYGLFAFFGLNYAALLGFSGRVVRHYSLPWRCRGDGAGHHCCADAIWSFERLFLLNGGLSRYPGFGRAGLGAAALFGGE